MSTATDKANQRAARKAHRQAHNTDADRTVSKANKGNQQGRRAARQENFNAQGNKSAGDFNFDQHGKGHISNQEIRHLRSQGKSRDEITAAVTANGGVLGKKAQARLDRWGAAKEKAGAVKENPVNPTPTPPPTSSVEDSYNTETGDNTSNQTVDNSTNTNVNQDNDIVNNVSGNDNNIANNQDNSVNTTGGSTNTGSYQNSGVGSNGQNSPEASYRTSAVSSSALNSAFGTTTPSNSTQIEGSYNSSTGSNRTAQDVDSSSTINANQDNDINNNVSGDDNYIYNEQDNSIRNYGGDTRVFNYQSSGNPAMDSPASAATMAGYWDVDDSPGGIAGRLDQRVTMANDYAKDNTSNFDAIADSARHRARNNTYIDPAALDARVRARSTANFAKSTKRSSDLWGDVSQYGWGKPETPDPVEKPDYEEIGNAYTDF